MVEVCSEYSAVVKDLESRGIMPKKIPSLEPMQRAIHRIHLQTCIDPKRNVIIAGTNGKGSTAATLSRLLKDAGQSVGLYTSPHLVSVCERIRINEADLSEEVFVQAYCQLKHVMDEEHLTHFEALTLMAAFIFFSGKLGPPVHWGIWEVGMGGTWDATNAISHQFCILTSISLDHQSFLGSTVHEIAQQKLGVIGQHHTVISYPMKGELELLCQQVRQVTQSVWYSPKSMFLQSVDCLQTPWGQAKLALPGPRAAQNTALALTLFETLGFSPSTGLMSLQKVRWPGRWSFLPNSRFPCPVHLSGDHNVEGVKSLLEILKYFSWQWLYLIVAISEDKDHQKMLEFLLKIPRVRLCLTEASFKPKKIEHYPSFFREQTFFLDADFKKVLSYLEKISDRDDRVVVTGSLYWVGDVLRYYQLNSSGSFKVASSYE